MYTLNSTEVHAVCYATVYDARGNGGGGVCPTITGDHMGHANDYMAVVVMTYQSVAGTLNPGGHPGSYNGQDAYNDMLVTDERSMHGQRTALPNYNETNSKQLGLYARCTGNNHMGGV